MPKTLSFTSNPVLITVKQNWQGTPLDEDSKFIFPENPSIFSFKEILKFLFERNPQREIKKRDTWRIPVVKNDNWLEDSSNKIVWLGHASFFIQLSGIRILIDPIFGSLPFTKRYSELPTDSINFKSIDYILISHTHFDHCDKKTIKLLAANNPNAQILCGLKLEKLIAKWVSNQIQSAGWYQQYKTNDALNITFLPAKHWANRSPFDVNTTLWGGFMLELHGKTIYFSGDSGHGSHFKEVGAVFPNIDIALIGVGAYSPPWFMGQNHQNPFNAVEAFHATGAKTLIPFHYGTFDLADEPMGEPEIILNKLNEEGKINNELKILKLGETVLV
jgi:L-ascorbate metabolism protein UlaG (beta-lactamase superfamily)